MNQHQYDSFTAKVQIAAQVVFLSRLAWDRPPESNEPARKCDEVRILMSQWLKDEADD